MRKVLNVLASLLIILVIVLAFALPMFGQARGVTQPVVGNKYLYGPITATTATPLWTTAQPALNYSNAIVHWVTSGSPTCSMAFKTGPTAALAVVAVDDPNATINCASTGTKVVSGVNNYFNITPTFNSGGLTVYVTLTNFAGNALNQTLSTVAQGAGAASPGALPWYVRLTDGTNLMPAGDAQARGINMIPGNGTNAAKHILDGVGTQGAGVLQTAELFTLSTAVASATKAQVVAAPGTGSIYLGRLLIETATASTGSVTVQYGTGTNCGTGTTTLFGPVTVPSPGILPVGILLPAQKALCLVTDGSGTSVRALTQ